MITVEMVAMVAAIAMASKHGCRDHVGDSTNRNSQAVEIIVVKVTKAIILLTEKWRRWTQQ